MEWFLKVIKQYADFSGRARRKEYWMYFLFYMIFYLILFGIDMALSLGFLAIIYALALLIPSLAVAVRRLHDIGKSGWFILISLIPFIGAIILIVFLVTDSQPGENQYGPNPKETAAQ